MELPPINPGGFEGVAKGWSSDIDPVYDKANASFEKIQSDFNKLEKSSDPEVFTAQYFIVAKDLSDDLSGAVEDVENYMKAHANDFPKKVKNAFWNTFMPAYNSFKSDLSNIHDVIWGHYPHGDWLQHVHEAIEAGSNQLKAAIEAFHNFQCP